MCAMVNKNRNLTVFFSVQDINDESGDKKNEERKDHKWGTKKKKNKIIYEATILC